MWGGRRILGVSGCGAWAAQSPLTSPDYMHTSHIRLPSGSSELGVAPGHLNPYDVVLPLPASLLCLRLLTPGVAQVHDQRKGAPCAATVCYCAAGGRGFRGGTGAGVAILVACDYGLCGLQPKAFVATLP